MHYQRSLSEQIIEANGQYVLAVKGNQKTLFNDIRSMMEHEADTPVTDSGHGRIETRSATVVTALDWLQEGRPSVARFGSDWAHYTASRAGRWHHRRNRVLLAE